MLIMLCHARKFLNGTNASRRLGGRGMTNVKDAF
jgi:hypothetical protein